MLPLIYPDWPIQEKVYAFTTTRVGGVSLPPFDKLNLASHVEDKINDVHRNRSLLHQYLPVTTEVKWIKQVHGDHVVDAACIEADNIEADAVYSIDQNNACAVLTADCLPILLSDQNGQCVAAVHAGWRGVVNGVIENTYAAMSEYVVPEYAWLGPAIGPQAFEVGEDVYSEYIKRDLTLGNCFTTIASADLDKWHLDIYLAAKMVLNQIGINKVFGGDVCTFSDADQFFSFRRAAITGRMATVICKR